MPAEMKKPLGILAGEGDLPRQLINHALAHDIVVCVVQFDGCAYEDATFSKVPTLKTPIEHVGAIFQFFRDHQIENVVMIGNLQRPKLLSLRPDWQGLKTFGRIGKALLCGGDDALLKTLKAGINSAGFTIVGVDHYLNDLTVEAGSLTRHCQTHSGNLENSKDCRGKSDHDGDFNHAIAEALRHGREDKGQSILWHTDGTYSYETRAGTSALIAREGRPGSILIKMVKPQQDPDLDRPTVGLETLKALQAKKCAGMIIQANGVFMINRSDMMEYANKYELFIEAVNPWSENQSIYIIAGEESGDVLGGRLLNSLKQRGDFTITGIGGQAMQAEGLKSLFPMEELSLMGLIEIIPHIPRLLSRIDETVKDIVAWQPDIVLTIDSPGFCKRAVKRARAQCPNTKFIHYVAPTVWAWRPRRAKKMAALFDGLICLFPFEPSYFEKEGLKAKYCGHPVVEKIPIVKKDRIDDHILILPGSRKGEVKRMAPVFAETFQKMRNMNPDLEAHVVALPHVQMEVEKYFPGAVFIDPANRYDAFQTAPFALATSGTVGLELAVAGCPHVIAYKVSPLTHQILKRMITVKYAHLVNIMEGAKLIPECIQDDCNSDDILAAVMNYKNPDLSKIREKLSGENPSKSPAEQAVEFMLEII